MLSTGPERSAKLKWRFFISFLLTAAFIIWMKSFLSPFHSGDIVEFEMAKTAERAEAILLQWQETGKFQAAIQSVYLDFIFIVFYTITIAFGCLYISSFSGNEILVRTGKFFAVLIFLAGIFDVVENFAMLETLKEGITSNQVKLAHNMAISKFSIILMTLFFMAICFVSYLGNLLNKKVEKGVWSN